MAHAPQAVCLELRTASPGGGFQVVTGPRWRLRRTLLLPSSRLKQQMARAVASWPHIQTRWLPGCCGRPAATWPALPVCAVAADSLLGSSPRSASDAASCFAPGNFTLERERTLAHAQPSLALLAARPSTHTPQPPRPCEDEPAPCWLPVTVLPPCPSPSPMRALLWL